VGSTASRFRITHPFHPFRGAEYELVTRKLTWGEDRVFYYDASGKLKSLLTNVTDVVSKDAYDRISAGRSAFRVDDLLELQRLFDRLKHRGKEEHSV
jgi:YD repeat-containing protein